MIRKIAHPVQQCVKLRIIFYCLKFNPLITDYKHPQAFCELIDHLQNKVDNRHILVLQINAKSLWIRVYVDLSSLFATYTASLPSPSNKPDFFLVEYQYAYQVHIYQVSILFVLCNALHTVFFFISPKIIFLVLGSISNSTARLFLSCSLK